MRNSLTKLSDKQYWLVAFAHRGEKFSEMNCDTWYCLRKALKLPIQKPLVYVDVYDRHYAVTDGYISATTSASKAFAATLTITAGQKNIPIMAAYLANMQKPGFKSIDVKEFQKGMEEEEANN